MPGTRLAATRSLPSGVSISSALHTSRLPAVCNEGKGHLHPAGPLELREVPGESKEAECRER